MHGITPDSFLQVADALPDPCLMVSGDGIILAANRRIAEYIKRSPAELQKLRFTDIINHPVAEIDAFLRQCARTRTSIPLTVIFDSRSESCRISGTLLQPRSPQSAACLMICVRTDDSVFGRFTVLNEKIDQLNREIEHRKLIETELRTERDLARFGRDIGFALTQELDLQPMLQRCAELMVKYLESAFARIWTLTEDGQALVLQASAGLYTHLDGKHHRIELGQFKIGQIAATRKPHFTNAVIGDPSIHDQKWAKREGMMAFAGYPLVVSEQVVGVMAMFARHRLSDHILDAMASVANSIALGIERLRITVTLVERTEALRIADQRKNEFLAMLGHELRNPLVPIRSGLELLQLDQENKELLQMLEEHVDHIVRLVDDLLDMSRITRSVIELRREILPLSSVMKRALDATRPVIDAKRHRLQVRYADPELWVDADPVRLTQVLGNLLSNAAKYTPPAGNIELESAHEQGQAVLRVRDNGRGIESQYLSDIFGLFRQLAPSVARTEGGLGIGLTVAQKIVELHGGHITAHSEGLNKGSQFSVWLPLAQAPDKRQVRQPATAPGRPGTDYATDISVLIVDDSEHSAQVMRQLLKAFGYDKVELAHDGYAALAVAETFNPQVIFLDIGLPGLDGHEVARRLRRKPGFATTMLVAITGYGSHEDQRLSREAGFDQHLIKPVSVTQLREVLATVQTRADTGHGDA